MTFCLLAPARAQDLVLDPAFTPPALESGPSNVNLLPISMAALPDGGLLVATNAAMIAGRNVPLLTKLRSDGSLDPAYAAPVFTRKPQIVHVYPDGRALVQDGRDQLLRLLPGGAVDPTFAAISCDPSYFCSLRLRDGRLLIGGINRIEGSETKIALLDAQGRLDRSFTTQAYARELALLADGRVLVTGSITLPDRTGRSLARMNLDGSFDPTFDTKAVPDSFIVAAPLADGRVLAASQTKLYRLLATGALDETYPPIQVQPNYPMPGAFMSANAGSLMYFLTSAPEAPGSNRLVPAIKRVLPDGRVDPAFTAPGSFDYNNNNDERRPLLASWDEQSFYLNGSMSLERGNLRQFLTRVTASGALDPAFTPRISTRATLVDPIVRAPDGKYLIWGGFDYAGGEPGINKEGNTLRLNADGSIDRSFVPPPLVRRGSSVYNLIPQGVQPDGRVLVIAADVVWRLGANGARDLTFPEVPARAIALGRDGSFVATEFDTGRLSRYRADGTRDPAFTTTATSLYSFLAVAADGKVLVETLGQVVRLNLDGSRDPSFTPVAVAGGTADRTFYALLGNGNLLGCGLTLASSIPSQALRRIEVYDPTGKTTLGVDVTSDLRKIGAALQNAAALNGGGSFSARLTGNISSDTDLIHVMDSEVTIMPAATDVEYHPQAPLTRYRAGAASAARWAPEIFSQPVGRTVTAGQTVSFALRALGQTDFTYQWYKDGVAFRGPQTSPTLILPNVQPGDAGDYTVEVRNSAGTVRSAAARLVIGQLPVLLQEPPPEIVIAEGQPLALTLGASGGGLRYLWQNAFGLTVADSSTSPTAVGGTYTAYLTGLRVSDSGPYRARVINSVGSIQSRTINLVVLANTPQSRLTNVSVRTLSGRGDGSLILGFAVAGGAAESLPVLIRGAGPALAAFGVGELLSDPKLSFRSATAVLAENDNWGGDAQVTAVTTQVGAFPFPAAGSKDAALYRPAVAPGSYTVQVAGADGGTGTALAEIYATPGAARIVNLSSRALVSPGEPLIAGFVISGDTAQTLLLRGVGPALAAFGVGGALGKAELTVYNLAGTKVAESTSVPNDANYVTETARAGAFALPAGDTNAALLVTLPPGAYTVQLRGPNGAGGTGLVELYQVR